MLGLGLGPVQQKPQVQRREQRVLELELELLEVRER